ncbi:MAG: hypothetical protein ABIB79_01790 [archaeon]
MDKYQSMIEHLEAHEVMDEVVNLKGRYIELVSVNYLGQDVFDIEEQDTVKGLRHTRVNSKTKEMMYWL